MKINNKNINTEIEKLKKNTTNMHFNQKREKSWKKKKETTIGDKSLDHHQHAPHQGKSMRWHFKCTTEGYFQTNGSVSRAVKRA